VTALLRIPAELHQLARARQFVADTARALGASAGAVDDLVLAVDESLTNIIEHGYGGGPGEVEVEVAREAETVIVRLRDSAAPFDPTQLPDPDLNLPLELRPVGGLGAYLVRQLVDQVIHQVSPQGGNILTLVKKLAGQAPAQGEDV